jgi:transcriptional regulator of acetoin/glycerol metabolism
MIAAIRRGIVMGCGEQITAADLALDSTQVASLNPVVPTVYLSRTCVPGSEEEKRRLNEALRRNGNNFSRAARELNISRITVYRMMRRNGLARNVLGQTKN